MEYYDFSYFIDGKIKKDVSSVVTIGVFEAFHKGHQDVIESLMRMKKETNAECAIVITFSINPKPGRSEKIDTLRLRKENLALYGIDCIVTIDFSQQFSKISASGFLKMLISSVNLKAIVVGEDFRFGSPVAAATAYELAPMLKALGCDASVEFVAPILMEGGEKISSTLLRRMIKEGRLQMFQEFSGQFYTLDLLESPYAIKGEELVLRTSDIHQLLPPQGAYDGILTFLDKRSEPVDIVINDDLLSITSRHNRFDALLLAQKDKLLLERKNDFS